MTESTTVVVIDHHKQSTCTFFNRILNK